MDRSGPERPELDGIGLAHDRFDTATGRRVSRETGDSLARNVSVEEARYEEAFMVPKGGLEPPHPCGH